MNHLAKLNFNAVLKYYLFVSWGLLTFSSCSVVNTLERGNGKNSPSFAVTSTKRIHGNQKTGLEAHNSKRVEIQTRPDSKELYSSSQNKSQTQKISEGAFKQNEESVSKEIERIEELLQIYTNSKTGNPTISSINSKSITRRMNIRTKQIQKIINTNYILQNTKNIVFTNWHSINNRSNLVQMKMRGNWDNLSTKQSVIPNSGSDILKWVLFGLGVILLLWIGGYGLIRFILPIGSGASLIIGVALFVACLVPGLFYLWASHLYDGLDNHSNLYRIGYWGTITLLPAIFALPIWVFAALRDSVRSGDSSQFIKLIANFFAWYFLILGEAFALLVTIATISISSY